MLPESEICISVVSHDQAPLIRELFASLEESGAAQRISVVLTVNNFERDLVAHPLGVSFPVHVITNRYQKGFGANHNAAFAFCRSAFFCVINPDIIFKHDPFPPLLALLNDSAIGAVTPTLINSDFEPQDNARQFPTPIRIIKRFIGAEKRQTNNNDSLLFPDWIAGMFMLFRASVYRDIRGFDEFYFMYCEDADICIRMKRAGFKVALAGHITAIHNARRTSHRKVQHLRWHVSSLLRFFFYHPFYRL